MEDPFLKLNILKDAAPEEVIAAHLKAIKGATVEVKKEMNACRNFLENDLNREMVKIHCFNYPSDDILFDYIKQSIKPW